MSNITLAPFFAGETRRRTIVLYGQDNDHAVSQVIDTTTPIAMSGGAGVFQITPDPDDNRSFFIKALVATPTKQLSVDVVSPSIPLPANRLVYNASTTAPVDNRRLEDAPGQ